MDKHELIDHNMTNHKPDEQSVQKIEYLRAFFKDLAHVVENSCPDSREKSLAMTNLEQALMWAVASIARNQ